MSKKESPKDKEYFDTGENAEKYLKMVEGYSNPSFLLKALRKNLPKGSSILEIGMGGGKDLEELSKEYDCYGSDGAKKFIEIYKKKKKRLIPDEKLFVLDARTLKIDKKFDCIYTNKVLMHLPVDDMKKSLKRQYEILKDKGILFHTLWHSKKTDHTSFFGLRFAYFSKEDVFSMFQDCSFKIIFYQIYKEEEANDSIVVICTKQKKK